MCLTIVWMTADAPLLGSGAVNRLVASPSPGAHFNAIAVEGRRN